MGSFEHPAYPNHGDGARLLAMGRIPRCEDCPRYHALVVAQAVPGRPRLPLPAAPHSCRYRICAPLVDRYEAALRGSGTVAVLGAARAARG